MKAGIIIDEWKLSIFERHLSQAGYTHNKGPGPIPGTLALTVVTENLTALGLVVRAANQEAAKTGKPSDGATQS